MNRLRFSCVKVLFAFIFALSLIAFADAATSDTPHLNVIEIKDTVNPGTEEFIRYAIERSETESAECMVILLDTPGGLMTSMRGIAQAILNSSIPIVVYVYPSGAQAASAGVFITVAADVAAMAPGTNIGAAHPVTGSGGDVPSTMNEKVVNDMLAFARSVAAQRGRNAEWLEKAIRESVSASAEEALQLNVVDLIADDIPALMKKLNGWEVERKGRRIALRTEGVEQRRIAPGLQHKVLRGISNPNIAYILLMIGLAGLYFELSQPGVIVPGVIGGIALILALYALQTLPVNYAGFLFILLAVLFFILEIKVTSHGLLSFAGVLSLTLGSVMLFRAPDSTTRLAWSVLIPTIATISAFFIAIAGLSYKAQRRKPQTGSEVLVGLIGEVTVDLSPSGKVFVYGESWNAEADEPISTGEKVEVLSVDNLKLKVKKIGVR